MYLAENHEHRFFPVPRDYDKWSMYEQMLMWSQRAARAADAFRQLSLRIDSLPTGSQKAAFQKKLGSKLDRHSPMSLYEWVWHHAAEPSVHVWNNQESQDRVEDLERTTRKIKKDMKSNGLGEGEEPKSQNPWVWIGIGGVGVLGLGYMLFAKKRKKK